MKPRRSFSALIFSWHTQERRGWYLLVLGLASVFFVGGTLLLFQVVYPASRPLTLTPQRIWLLDSSQPGARQIIAAAADKDFLLLGQATADSTQPAMAGQKSAFFAPSFQGRSLQPKDLLETRNATAALPRLFLPQRTLLPTLPERGQDRTPPAPKAQVLQAVVTSGLSQRAIIRQVNLATEALPVDKPVAFHIAVSPDGQVKVVVPLTSTAAQVETYRTLRAQLAGLRFSPRNAEAVEWGTLTFEWREVAP